MDASAQDAVVGSTNSAQTAPMSQQRLLILQLVGISATCLFLEMALIRFVSSTVQVIAYFNNFVILSTFLGMGCGALLANRARRLLSTFPFIFVVVVGLLVLFDRYGAVSADHAEVVAWTQTQGDFQLPVGWVVSLVFLGVIGFFVPLGYKLGATLAAFENRLEAYGYDILGSIGGVALFALMSVSRTEPWIWFSVGALAVLLLLGREQRGLSALALMAAGVFISTLPTSGQWSPYYKVQLRAVARTSADPPTYYEILVDKLRIQDAIDFDQDLAGSPVETWRPYYELPFVLRAPKRVLVLGGGSGNDTAIALEAGAEHVDVVEIDPILVELGHVLHPQRPYADERVRVINDDARAVLQQNEDPYDLIIMNALDSHAQLPGLSTLRLESYMYTVEAFRDVQRHMDDQSLFIVHLSSTRPWMGERLYASLSEAFGVEPALLATLGSPFNSIGFAFGPPELMDRSTWAAKGVLAIDPSGFRAARAATVLATDDWPHLYLAGRQIPSVYYTVLAIILVVTLGGFRLFGGVRANLGNLHFLLLGASFMLLETRAITEFSLLFGSTWFVNAIVIGSVLCVIYLGNLLLWKGFEVPKGVAYALTFASLVGLYLFPLNLLLQYGLAMRLAASFVLVGAPIFFASLIFSHSFRNAEDVPAAFGSNLVGVVAGGALEYTSMIFGLDALYLVAFAIYGLVWFSDASVRARLPFFGVERSLASGA